MYRVKKQYIGVQLYRGNRVTVLTNQLGQEELKKLAEDRATSTFIEKSPTKPEVKPEVKKPKQKEVKDERTRDGHGPTEADPGSFQ